MAPKPKFVNITPVTYSSLGWTFDAKNGRQPISKGKIVNNKAEHVQASKPRARSANLIL